MVIQQNSRKLLMVDILMSETCWAHKKWNKIASDIKLVFYSSTVTMMHGPIDIINTQNIYHIVQYVLYRHGCTFFHHYLLSFILFVHILLATRSKAWSTAARLLWLWVRIAPRGSWMSVVSVVCCQVKVSATNWSLVQRSHAECGASLCLI